MAGQDLRKRFMRRFVGMEKYSRSEAVGIVAVYVATIAVSVFAGHYLLSLPLTWITATLMFSVAVFIGTRLRGLNNIVHECTHSTFCEDRGDNVTLGRFCSSLLIGCFKEYKHDHLSHHAHLGDYHQDREMGPIEKFALHEPISARTILRHFITPLMGRHLKMYSGINLSGSDGAPYLALKIVLLVAICAFTLVHPLTSLVFILLPLFYIFPTINFWTDCLDHAGIVGEDDELEATRNVLASTPVKLLFFPRNDCFHLVHHLFPQVPARHLETAHHELLKDSTYQNSGAAMKPIYRSLTQPIAKVT